jgi:aldose sugar dehydrogenase
MNRTKLFVGAICTAIIAPGIAHGQNWNEAPPNAPHQRPFFDGQTRAPMVRSRVAFSTEIIATELQNPWGMAFLPDGRMLVTERTGRLRIITHDGTISPAVEGLPEIMVKGQGGLLGIAVDPNYASSGLIYWSYSEPQADGTNNTAVARGRLVDGQTPRVQDVQGIFHQKPSLDSPLHFGGRLVFAPDGKLFITLGERSITPGRMQAQQLDSLLGKMVRLNPDGSIPSDNPFVGKVGAGPEIWSYGHRNIQAAAINPATGELWVAEHGVRGGDELNVPRKGRDYGWPTIAYGIEYKGGTITGGITAQAGMEQPLYYWDPVIAPSGMTFYTGSLFPEWKGSLFVGGLRGATLVRLSLDGERVVGEERLLLDQRERIRDVVQGPEGALYLLTDDPKGRLFKIVPAAGRSSIRVSRSTP